MDDDTFNALLRKAESAVDCGADALYWCGFSRGLRRAHFGRRFSSNTDHFAWLDFARDTDPCVSELGRGYRDGLEASASGRVPSPEARADSLAARRRA